MNSGKILYDVNTLCSIAKTKVPKLMNSNGPCAFDITDIACFVQGQPTNCITHAPFNFFPFQQSIMKCLSSHEVVRMYKVHLVIKCVAVYIKIYVFIP